MKNVPVTVIMTKDITVVSPGQKLLDVKHIFEKQKFHHHIPVTENGMLVGMISMTDFLYAISSASISDEDRIYQELTVKDIMRENPTTMGPQVTVKEVGEELLKGQVHAIVIAENKKILGIVSTSDVIRYFIKNS